MPPGLRRGLTSYGDPAFSLFLRRAFIKAMGYSDDALSRPIIGITDTRSDYNACHANVPALIDAARRGILLAGGLPMAFPTISIHESFAHPTSMFLRNLMAMDTEELARAQPMDALLLIGGCDKTVPAQLMAAASLDIPAIQLVTGPMLTGHYQGERLGACTDCRRFWARHRAGEFTEAEMDTINARLAPTAGTCMVMGTASTMACLAEALGLALPGTATIPAPHADRLRAAEQSGATAVAAALAPAGRRPADLLTPIAFRNAQIVLHAIGGSTNALIHLAAIAGRRGLALDLDAFDALGRETPVLLDLKPTGDGYMEDFHASGGLPRLMAELRDRLDLSAPTVTGHPLSHAVDAAEQVPSQTTIRPRHNPIAPAGSIAVLRGNLAPGGAVIKHVAATPALLTHTGPAFVFENVEDLTNRIDDPDLDVTPETVLVLRNTGPKGAPGMPEAGYLPIPKKLARAGVRDMVRLSDARMSGTAFGTIILHVTPESYEGSPLALIQTGDQITLDVPNRTLTHHLSDAELTRRRTLWQPPPPHPGSTRGYLHLYLRSVLQPDQGCDFDFLRPNNS